MKFLSKSLNARKGKDGKKGGFTLVEILIVVAVIGILFVTLVPRIDFAGDKARETGVKTDFRSFELAAEQIMRENGGVKDFADAAALCGDEGINMFLDEALKFDSSTLESGKEDPWNQKYTIQFAKDTTSGANENNGTIIFVANGKDSFKDKEADNYVLVVTYVDGQISSKTSGFSTNIESDAINDIAVGSSAATMTVASEKATVTYDKD